MARFLRYLGGAVLFALLVAVTVYIATGPERPASDSLSAQWLESGPYRVGLAEFAFVDSSRITEANREAPQQDQRRLPTTLWYPRNFDGDRLALIIHSHGILSSATEMSYLMEALASRGYVVAAPTFPLTSSASPSGANASDVINQPADVSFLIDSIMNLDAADKPFSGAIDVDRIGLSGYSLGGLTTYLATYHVQLRDPRIDAAVAIAGPSAVFAPRFFDTAALPFLAVAGTADALIEYERNAENLLDRGENMTLVSIEGGSHLGFVGAAEPIFRFMDNPDSIGCSAVLAALGEDTNALFAALYNPATGVDRSRDVPGICADPVEAAIHPGRQQMINQVAIVSFFESEFSPDAQRRQQARQTLQESIAEDFEEVRLQQ